MGVKHGDVQIWFGGKMIGRAASGELKEDRNFFATVTWSYNPVQNYHGKKVRIKGSGGLDRTGELVAVEDKMEASKANFLMDPEVQ